MNDSSTPSLVEGGRAVLVRSTAHLPVGSLVLVTLARPGSFYARVLHPPDADPTAGAYVVRRTDLEPLAQDETG